MCPVITDGDNAAVPPSTEAKQGRRTEAGGFGIGAVSQMTGIDEHTLRIWERRYGFPHPERSSGGTRLYTEADVYRLRLIRQALARGHRPREVVGKDVAAMEALATQQESIPSPVPPTAPDEIEAILAALKRDDVNAVRAGLRNLAILHGPRGFVLKVAQPLLSQVGQLWRDGELEIHQEHLLSQCMSTQLRILGSLHENTSGPVVVLATLPNELHGLGLEMVALYLASAGASPRVIGVSTPKEQIVLAAHAHQATAVGLSILASSDLLEAASEIRQLALRLPRNAVLWLGGAGATSLPPIEGASIVATWDDLDDVLRTRMTMGGRSP
jgi:MerR family transcriptional regulator, light-induced transcriptional regulator